MRKPTFWFPTWSDTNQAVQLQKMARGLKFRIYKVEGLYYLCSENKGADQLRGYRGADLRLCFRICKKPVFSGRNSNVVGSYKNPYTEVPSTCLYGKLQKIILYHQISALFVPVLHQSFVTLGSKPQGRTAVEMCYVFAFAMSSQCGGNTRDLPYIAKLAV